MVYFLGLENRICAVDASNGGVFWELPAGYSIAELEASACISNGVVYADIPYPTAIDAGSGAIIWELEPELEDRINKITSLSVGEGMVFFGIDNLSKARVAAADIVSGKTVWEFQVGAAPISSPCYSEGIVYFTTDASLLYALNARNGEVLWMFHGCANVSPCIAGSSVYLLTSEGHLVALDKTTGRKTWEAGVEQSLRTAAVYADGLVFCCSDDEAKLYVFDALSGQVIWTFQAKYMRFPIAPLVHDGVVYLCDSQHIYAIE